MSRIFISGSSTGLGLMTADLLSSQGHKVVIHARNANRAEDAARSLPEAEAVVIGGSAGAFEALSALLPGLAPDYPLPILIVGHLPPTRTSLRGG